VILRRARPKRIALRNPEGIAVTVARPMRLLSKVAYPLVRFLSVMTESVLKLLGLRPTQALRSRRRRLKS